jgi:hypothetical protein
LPKRSTSRRWPRASTPPANAAWNRSPRDDAGVSNEKRRAYALDCLRAAREVRKLLEIFEDVPIDLDEFLKKLKSFGISASKDQMEGGGSIRSIALHLQKQNMRGWWNAPALTFGRSRLFQKPFLKKLYGLAIKYEMEEEEEDEGEIEDIERFLTKKFKP